MGLWNSEILLSYSFFRKDNLASLWKERCRRVFDNKACTTQEILQRIANDVRMLQLAQEEYW